MFANVCLEVTFRQNICAGVKKSVHFQSVCFIEVSILEQIRCGRILNNCPGQIKLPVLERYPLQRMSALRSFYCFYRTTRNWNVRLSGFPFSAKKNTYVQISNCITVPLTKRNLQEDEFLTVFILRLLEYFIYWCSCKYGHSFFTDAHIWFSYYRCLVPLPTIQNKDHLISNFCFFMTCINFFFLK